MFAQLGYYICVPFAWLTRLFYTWTGSYGVALILFTLIVKLVLLPFQLKSKKSMLRMGRMNSKVQEIQKKYANNKERQQQEIADLYAREGVNPMSGCLWSFLPFPILIALYAIIRQPLRYLMGLSMDTISAITDRGEYAACKVTVRKESGDAASKKPALDHTTLNLVIQYNNAHPSQKLQLINTSGSFVYAYQWMSSNPEVATVDPEGLVTAQKPGTTTVTALATNGQALRCAVTVNSDVGKVTLNKRDLLLRTVGSKEALTASVAVENGVNVPITWVSSNPGVATVDASGVVTAVADGEAKITALSPDGRFDSCSVFVGLAADKYDTEEDLAEELKLPDPYVAVRMNRLS